MYPKPKVIVKPRDNNGGSGTNLKGGDNTGKEEELDLTLYIIIGGGVCGLIFLICIGFCIYRSIQNCKKDNPTKDALTDLSSL